MAESVAGLRAPFPWFGGKTRAAPLIWERLGPVPNYVEPFAGALGCLLARPYAPGIETINDLDGFVANAWRAISLAPEATAQWADWPVSECCLHARHLWLRERRASLSARLMADPDYCDPKIAGWWLWGISCWIGGGWCGAGSAGPWGVVDGHFVHLGNAGQGVQRQLPHLGDAGRGVKRLLPHLGTAGRGVTRKRPLLGGEGSGQGVKRLLPHLSDAGQGVIRQRPHLGGAGPAQGIHTQGTSQDLRAYFQALSARLRRTRVCCGDWQRIMGESVTVCHGLTGILLDPPYSQEEGRDKDLYAEESATVAHDVREWCLANGHHPLLRIVLCGYGDVHDALLAQGWVKQPWKTNGGMGNQGQGRGRANKAREMLWCSSACLLPVQGTLL